MKTSRFESFLDDFLASSRWKNHFVYIKLLLKILSLLLNTLNVVKNNSLDVTEKLFQNKKSNQEKLLVFYIAKAV